MLKSRKLLCVFVPRWGWVVSLHTNDFIKLDMFSSPSGDRLVQEVPEWIDRVIPVFVPAWGWVGSVDNSNSFGDGTLFSSPLGDGVVR